MVDKLVSSETLNGSLNLKGRTSQLHSGFHIWKATHLKIGAAKEL